ncbi:leucine-rich repeat, immunoglobulin-like domain and transmembrane domain-containing protein 3b isoform X2 [Onychostoma macrolepis]|uniref:leucine-rich repeat, immunoglobulin-like domain and transmembrane domain-containing protein 3b isoform X2 n=1 Tax=Onychostoma macrolepis TaxID=369639 RepID=UPI00272C70B0|nr:leucine-rich repeat, immunoglobulin-like domain and transmembrane domain-containing protein 3b isoform X2 [Onychostoma macrolepis]
MHPLLYADLTLCLALVVCAQSPSCPSLCTCVLHGRSNAKGLRTVLCKNPALTAIPVDLPSDAVKFRLERTSVSRIFRGAFSAMPELLYLWLTYNSITVLHPKSFTNLSFLHELRLDGNLLSSFPWEGLRDVPRLRTLGLHNNRLARIPPLAARYLANVTYLDLSSNRLSTLPNDLTALWPFSDSTQTQRSVVLGLQDNPWVCDCRLSTLLDISKAPETSLVLLDRFLTCSEPPDLAGVPFQSVELTRCRRPYVVTSATKITALLGSNVLLRCEATGHPTPTLTWIKSAIPNIYKQDVQESPRVGIRWSAVSLNGISYSDAGEYRCRAQNMAGISEAIVSLNVVGVMAEYADSKNSDQQQTAAKSNNTKRKPNQKSKAILSLLPRNMTRPLSPPKRVMKIPKASRDKMKRDRTAVQSLPQRHFLIASENPLHRRQKPRVSMSVHT